MSNLGKNYDGTPKRALEWMDKANKRCHKCKRLRPNEFFKPGPLIQEDGVTVRLYECKPKCAPPKVDHYEAARPPRHFEGQDPPLVKRPKESYLQRGKKAPKGKRVEFHVKRDLVRIALSTASRTLRGKR